MPIAKLTQFNPFPLMLLLVSSEEFGTNGVVLVLVLNYQYHFVDELNGHALNRCHDVYNTAHDHYGNSVTNGELVTMRSERNSLDMSLGHMGMPPMSPLNAHIRDCGALSCDPLHKGYVDVLLQLRYSFVIKYSITTFLPSTTNLEMLCFP